MIFIPKRDIKTAPNLNLTLNGSRIIQVHSAKFLGVIIDDSLNWKDHIQSIYSNLLKYISLFYKIRNILPMHIMKNIYYATVHPKLLYGIEVYANTCQTYLDNLIIRNNKILRVAQSKPFDTPTLSLYTEYNTLPIDILFKYNSLLLAHKISHHAHLLPNVFANYFLINKDVHSHDTRSKDLVHLPQYNKNIGHRNFKYLGGSLWNAIPKELKDIIRINLFKKSIKTYLLRLLQNIT